MAAVFPRLGRSLCRRNPETANLSFPPFASNDARLAANMIQYSRQMLKSLQNRSSRPRIKKSIYYRLKDCGVLRPFRGCRTGKAIKFLKDGDSLNIRIRVTNRVICIPWSQRSEPFSRNLVHVRKVHASIQQSKEFGPSLLLANMMSLSPKIDELRCLVIDKNPDLVSLTET